MRTIAVVTIVRSDGFDQPVLLRLAVDPEVRPRVVGDRTDVKELRRAER